MIYLHIPEGVDVGNRDDKGAVIPYTLQHLLAQFVWPLSSWRQSAAAMSALISLGEKLGPQKPIAAGASVAMTDEEGEMLRARVQEMKTPDGLVLTLAPLLYAVLSAGPVRGPSSDPSPAKDAQ